MLVAIFICIYWIWIIDIFNSLRGNINTLVPSTMAVILLSWQLNQAWGIIMTCIGVVIVMISLIRYFKYKK